MKKFFIAFLIAGVVTACNNSADSAAEAKDSIDSVASEKIDAIDSTAEQKMENIDSTADAKKAALDSLDNNRDSADKN